MLKIFTQDKNFFRKLLSIKSNEKQFSLHYLAKIFLIVFTSHDKLTSVITFIQLVDIN